MESDNEDYFVIDTVNCTDRDDNGEIHVNLKLERETVNMKVDTGAKYNVITKFLASKISNAQKKEAYQGRQKKECQTHCLWRKQTSTKPAGSWGGVGGGSGGSCGDVSDTEQGDIVLETLQESDSSDEDIADTQVTQATQAAGGGGVSARSVNPSGVSLRHSEASLCSPGGPGVFPPHCGQSQTCIRG